MTRQEIITDLKPYFDIRELVEKKTYNKLGDNAWSLFATEALHTLLILRKNLNRRITINDWKWNGSSQQRGHRSNLSQIVKDRTKRNILYLSGHPLGMAFDILVNGMEAEEVRNWIKENKDIFPYKIRLEHLHKDTHPNSPTYGEMIPISWVHIDVKYYEDNPKVYLFNV